MQTFVLLGLPGIFLMYISSRREDGFLINKFGDEYKEYMNQVPAMNILTGILRKMRSGSSLPK